jgi:hypothetical protein
MKAFCGTFGPVCDGISKLLNLETSPYNDPEREQVVDARPGSSASIRQLIHYAQLVNEGIFMQYDWGNDSANIAHYGSKTVPLIVLELIAKVPVAMLVGKQDDLADPVDTNNEKARIKTLAFYKEYDNMDHYSFSIGKNMGFVSDVISLINSHKTT